MIEKVNLQKGYVQKLYGDLSHSLTKTESGKHSKAHAMRKGRTNFFPSSFLSSFLFFLIGGQCYSHKTGTYGGLKENGARKEWQY